MSLEEAYNKAVGVEDAFDEQGVLFIGTESYDAPAITVLQGLDKLGFNVYTLEKGNINSWFCNQIIDDPSTVSFDFVLSNFHWGTRWSHYNRYSLNAYPCVLIDGDDNPGLGTTWCDKYQHYCENVYEFDPPEDTKDRELMPYRWVEPLGKYEPDIVFTSQKQFEDGDSHYLPFGIHDQYHRFADSRPLRQRELDLTHIPGSGKRRKRMERLVNILGRLRIIPGTIYNQEARGEAWYPEDIAEFVEADDNVHSYHRWKLYDEYFNVLNNTRILVYPGVDTHPFWDSKRLWEALSCGCFVLFSEPVIDDSEYPITGLCEEAVFNSYWEFIRTYRRLYNNPDELDSLRIQMVERAHKYFTPTAVARYFLSRIRDEVL